MKRAAQPEELSPAFGFMAAPSCSSYITGEILPVIGGYRLRISIRQRPPGSWSRRRGFGALPFILAFCEGGR